MLLLSHTSFDSDLCIFWKFLASFGRFPNFDASFLFFFKFSPPLCVITLLRGRNRALSISMSRCTLFGYSSFFFPYWWYGRTWFSRFLFFRMTERSRNDYVTWPSRNWWCWASDWWFWILFWLWWRNCFIGFLCWVNFLLAACKC